MIHECKENRMGYYTIEKLGDKWWIEIPKPESEDFPESIEGIMFCPFCGINLKESEKK